MAATGFARFEAAADQFGKADAFPESFLPQAFVKVGRQEDGGSLHRNIVAYICHGHHVIPVIRSVSFHNRAAEASSWASFDGAVSLRLK